MEHLLALRDYQVTDLSHRIDANTTGFEREDDRTLNASTATWAPLAQAWLATFALAVGAATTPTAKAQSSDAEKPTSSQLTGQWRHYGGSLSGQRFAGHTRITTQNAGELTEAWRVRTGDGHDGTEFDGSPSKFRATPVLVNGRLYVSTGFNRVLALSPQAGEVLWRFDPQVDFSEGYAEMFTSRGVAVWAPVQHPTERCNNRVFIGTLDARLIALDAADGRLCTDFGKRGEVNLAKGIGRVRHGEYSVTTPPLVIADRVIVGSSVGDNGGAELESGQVRAFDVRSGKLLWSWDPIPRHRHHPGVNTWPLEHKTRTGAANVWSAMSGDPQHDLVYLPTSSPSPDFFGGLRLGDNAFANSVVALQASTGEFRWGYQTVRHDLWDYDLAAQPMLFELATEDGDSVPVLAQATKMGFIHLLHRLTGEPLAPTTEQPVPRSDVSGEQAAATQPFASLRLHPTKLPSLRIWEHSPEHRSACEKMLHNVRYEGIFTPPSLQGTLLYPGNAGGTNWGSMAYNPGPRVAYLTINRLPTVVKLIPREAFAKAKANGKLNGVEAQYTEQKGTDFGMARFDVYHRDTGLPCLEGPWASLIAIDMALNKVLWEVPAGRAPGLEDDSVAADWGYFAVGGPMVTAGNVVFLATPFDFALRAYHGLTGELLWTQRLPAGAHATPMAYRYEGGDYVVITAGDAQADGSGRGDYVIAYSLPKLTVTP